MAFYFKKWYRLFLPRGFYFYLEGLEVEDDKRMVPHFRKKKKKLPQAFTSDVQLRKQFG